MSKERERRERREIEGYVRDLRKDADKRLFDIKRQLNVLHGTASKTMAKRPLLALGVALLIGMALGVALSKSKD